MPRLKAKVHGLITKKGNKINLEDIYFTNQFDECDIDELKVLQEEWFPLRYDQSYYNKLVSNRLGAFLMKVPIIKHDPNSEPNQDDIILSDIFGFNDNQNTHMDCDMENCDNNDTQGDFVNCVQLLDIRKLV